MTRTITVGVASALEQPHVTYLMFVEMVFDGGTSRWTNANRSFDWDGHTWIGVGALGSIDAIEEGADTQARGIRLTISGVEPDNLALALGEDCQGRACNLWLALVNADTQAILADPIGPFRYRMDTMTFELGETATVTVTAESRLIDLTRARIRRYNDEDQRAEYPDDRGFEFTALMVERQLAWGVKA